MPTSTLTWHLRFHLPISNFQDIFITVLITTIKRISEENKKVHLRVCYTVHVYCVSGFMKLHSKNKRSQE